MRNQRLVRLCPLILLLASALPARAQDAIEYRWNTGALLGRPVSAGRNVAIRMSELNPLCFSYTVEAKPHTAPVDLSKLVEAINAAAPAGEPDSNKNASMGSEMLGQIGGAAFVTQKGRSSLAARGLNDILRETRAVTDRVNRLRADLDAAEAAIALAESPKCDGTTSLAAALEAWKGATTPDPLANVATRIAGARDAIRAVEARLEAVRSTGATPPALALGAAPAAAAVAAADAETLDYYQTRLNDARNQLTLMEGERPDLMRRMLQARAIMRSAEIAGDNAVTHVFVPQGSDSLNLVLIRTALHADSGKPAAVVTRTHQLPVRNGMRFFVSAGAMASTLRTHDYRRVNRAFADTSKGVYSTYANVSRGDAFAFSPVLQGNVAFREIGSSGISPLLSAGIAVRSVNGGNAPEFLFGTGISFLDRLVLTGGVHLGRRERLLIGDPSTVSAGAVPEEVTEESAIGEEWKPAFVTTFSVRLN